MGSGGRETASASASAERVWVAQHVFKQKDEKRGSIFRDLPIEYKRFRTRPGRFTVIGRRVCFTCLRATPVISTRVVPRHASSRLHDGLHREVQRRAQGGRRPPRSLRGFPGEQGACTHERFRHRTTWPRFRIGTPATRDPRAGDGVTRCPRSSGGGAAASRARAALPPHARLGGSSSVDEVVARVPRARPRRGMRARLGPLPECETRFFPHRPRLTGLTPSLASSGHQRWCGVHGPEGQAARVVPRGEGASRPVASVSRARGPSVGADASRAQRRNPKTSTLASEAFLRFPCVTQKRRR